MLNAQYCVTAPVFHLQLSTCGFPLNLQFKAALPFYHRGLSIVIFSRTPLSDLTTSGSTLKEGEIRNRETKDSCSRRSSDVP
jgi:hypothetical protein